MPSSCAESCNNLSLLFVKMEAEARGKFLASEELFSRLGLRVFESSPHQRDHNHDRHHNSDRGAQLAKGSVGGDRSSAPAAWALISLSLFSLYM